MSSELQAIRSAACALNSLCLARLPALTQMGDINSQKILDKMMNGQYSQFNDFHLDLLNFFNQSQTNFPEKINQINSISNDLKKITESTKEDTVLSVQLQSLQEKVNINANELMNQVYTHVGKNGLQTASSFIKLPSRSSFNDYYEEIKFPMSLTQINYKIKKCKYYNVCEVLNDLTLCFKNAQDYNIEDSKIYKDSQTLYFLVAKYFSEFIEKESIIPLIYSISPAQKFNYDLSQASNELNVSQTSKFGAESLNISASSSSASDFYSHVVQKMLKMEKNGINIYEKLVKNSKTENLNFVKSVSSISVFSYKFLDDYLVALYDFINQCCISKELELEDIEYFSKNCTILINSYQGLQLAPFTGYLISFIKSASHLLEKFLLKWNFSLEDIKFVFNKLGLDHSNSLSTTCLQYITQNSPISIEEMAKFFGLFISLLSKTKYKLTENFLIDSNTLLLHMLNIGLEYEILSYKLSYHQNENVVDCPNTGFRFYLKSVDYFSEIFKNLSESFDSKFLEIFSKKHYEVFCEFMLFKEMIYFNGLRDYQSLINFINKLLTVSQKCYYSLQENILQHFMKIFSDSISIIKTNFKLINQQDAGSIFDKNFVDVYVREFYMIEERDNMIVMLNEVSGRNGTCQILKDANSSDLKHVGAFRPPTLENEYYLTEKTELINIRELTMPVNVIPRHFRQNVKEKCAFKTFICDFKLSNDYIAEPIVCMPSYEGFNVVQDIDQWILYSPIFSKIDYVPLFEIYKGFYEYRNNVTISSKAVRELTSISLQSSGINLFKNSFYRGKFEKKSDHIVQIMNIEVRNGKLTNLLVRPFLIQSKSPSEISPEIKYVHENWNLAESVNSHNFYPVCVKNGQLNAIHVPYKISSTYNCSEKINNIDPIPLLIQLISMIQNNIKKKLNLNKIPFEQKKKATSINNQSEPIQSTKKIVDRSKNIKQPSSPQPLSQTFAKVPNFESAKINNNAPSSKKIKMATKQVETGIQTNESMKEYTGSYLFNYTTLNYQKKSNTPLQHSQAYLDFIKNI
ncbi:MAG: Protein polybromo-1 [Paramarteilia canceri]